MPRAFRVGFFQKKQPQRRRRGLRNQGARTFDRAGHIIGSGRE
jgi:hypothetical protein